MSEANPISQRKFTIIDEVRAPVTRKQRILRFINQQWGRAKKRLGSLYLQARTIAKSTLSRVFAVDRKTTGIRFLAITTTLYLLIEFAFSAWLIDVMGTLSDRETILKAEHYGRLISGFAVALLFWGAILKKRRIFDRYASLVLTTTVVMVGVYQVERALIDRLVRTSDEHARAAAVTGSLLHASLVNGQIDETMLDGFWSGDVENSTVGKAFIGVSSFLAASSDTAKTQTMELAPQVIRGIIDKSAGGVSGEFERFQESQSVIRDQFKTYQEGHKQYQQARIDSDKFAAQAWEDYLDRLEARHRYWGRYLIGKRRDGQLVIERAVKPTIKAVQDSGIPVPNNWNTGDKRTFVQLAKREYLKKAKKTFDTQLRGVPANLNLTQFSANKVVQDEWKKSLHYSPSIGTLPIQKLSLEQFNSRIYTKVLAERAQESLNSYAGKVGDYADGGDLEELGKSSYEGMIAPVFALSLSLLGALVHLLKSGLLVLHVFSGVHLKSPITKGLVIFSAVICSLIVASKTIETPLTSHKTYLVWINKGNDSASNSFETLTTQLAVRALDATIKAQSVAYPAFSFVKNQFDAGGRLAVSVITKARAAH